MKKEHSKSLFAQTFRYESVKQWRDSSSAFAVFVCFLFTLGFLLALSYWVARGSFSSVILRLDEGGIRELQEDLARLDPNSREAALDRFLLAQNQNSDAFYGAREGTLLPSSSSNFGASFAFTYLFFSLPCSLLFALYPLYQVSSRTMLPVFRGTGAKGIEVQKRSDKASGLISLSFFLELNFSSFYWGWR
jgi:hypothetical protein